MVVKARLLYFINKPLRNGSGLFIIKIKKIVYSALALFTSFIPK